MGRRLLSAALARFAPVRQKVLLTDDEPQRQAFYWVLGLSDTHDLSTTPIRTLVRFERG